MPVIRLVQDPRDEVAASPPVAWALGRLRARLRSAGTLLETSDQSELELAGPALVLTTVRDEISELRLRESGIVARDVAETFALLADREAGGGMLVFGSDVRGLVYGLLELADRVPRSGDVTEPFRGAPIVEEPANEVRSVARLFCSEVEDKPWFYDLDWWDRYLSMLIESRFNRCSLTFGLGYNYHRAITD